MLFTARFLESYAFLMLGLLIITITWEFYYEYRQANYKRYIDKLNR
jgi:hypothetical protein